MYVPSTYRFHSTQCNFATRFNASLNQANITLGICKASCNFMSAIETLRTDFQVYTHASATFLIKCSQSDSLSFGAFEILISTKFRQNALKYPSYLVTCIQRFNVCSCVVYRPNRKASSTSVGTRIYVPFWNLYSNFCYKKSFNVGLNPLENQSNTHYYHIPFRYISVEFFHLQLGKPSFLLFTICREVLVLIFKLSHLY
jgi:hypothetical protein